MSKLTLKIFVHEGGKAPTKGKEGDAGLDCFACLPLERRDVDHVTPEGAHQTFKGGLTLYQGQLIKVSLGFSYAFWVDGEVSHDYWLDVRNRSGVGTKSGLATVAEVGDANYRGVLHYCAAKITNSEYYIAHGDKIAQALINPFVDPHKVDIRTVGTIEELGTSARGSLGFGSSGK